MTDFVLIVLIVIFLFVVIAVAIGIFAQRIIIPHWKKQNESEGLEAQRQRDLRQKRYAHHSLIEERRAFIDRKMKEGWTREQVGEQQETWTLEDAGIMRREHIVTIGNVIISYYVPMKKEVVHLEDKAFADIDKKIGELFTANPDVDLHAYAKQLGIYVLRIDRKKKKEFGFIPRSSAQ